MVLIVLDQLVKLYIVSDLSWGRSRVSFRICESDLSSEYRRSLSMLENQQWLFTLVTFLVIGVAVYYLIKHLHASKWMLAGLTLVIAGGLGNFIDRIRQGFVVDMFQLDFINFAIFNVADMYLTFGVAILLLMILKEEKDGSKN
ncbi:signal peptidase II [Streptococcus sanguinis]|uniref:Lipoprotein signal peptidase n=1 Tax=Streptococcus sanguinis TaxID=1305 RepID=A0A7Y0VBL7_STRSA|nr:signal peptidase II [Streptococcus sanguinis]